MTDAELLQIVTDCFWTLLAIAWPVLAVALVVGLAISFLQALTQIQEMTLTFVPKFIAICVVATLTLPMSYDKLASFTHRLADVIVAIGR
jgi:flagellar biosynthetic protein FliQ